MNNKIDYIKAVLETLREFELRDPKSDQLKRLIRYIELGKGAISKTAKTPIAFEKSNSYAELPTQERSAITKALVNCLLYDKNMSNTDLAKILKVTVHTVKCYNRGKTACKQHNLAKLKFLVKYLDLQGKKYSDLTYNELIILKGELQDAQTHDQTEGGSNG